MHTKAVRPHKRSIDKAKETYYKAKETYYKAKETYYKAKEIYWTNDAHKSFRPHKSSQPKKKNCSTPLSLARPCTHIQRERARASEASERAKKSERESKLNKRERERANKHYKSKLQNFQPPPPPTRTPGSPRYLCQNARGDHHWRPLQ